jgi:hypothetical protein
MSKGPLRPCPARLPRPVRLLPLLAVCLAAGCEVETRGHTDGLSWVYDSGGDGGTVVAGSATADVVRAGIALP